MYRVVTILWTRTVHVHVGASARGGGEGLYTDQQYSGMRSEQQLRS